MNLTQLKGLERTRKKPMKRKARGPGSGKGKTAGRGGKGHSARTGFANRYYFEGGQMPLVRRLPKHGFNNVLFRKENAVLNVSQLEESFEAGEAVGPDEFLKAGIINRVLDGVKVLGDGDLTKKLHVKAHAFSKSAREKIEKAGGSCTYVDPELAAEREKKIKLREARAKAEPKRKAQPVEAAKAEGDKDAKPAKADKPPKAEKPKPEGK